VVLHYLAKAKVGHAKNIWLQSSNNPYLSDWEEDT
jgi:hypothetical protein